MNLRSTFSCSPVPRRESPDRLFPLLAASVCVFACAGGDPPRTCGAIPRQTVFVGREVSVIPCFEDPEGGALTLSASSSDAEVATGAVADSTIRIEAVSPGTATISVVATDSDDLTAQQEVKVLVPDNLPPEVCGTIPEEITLQPRQTILLLPCFEDPEGEELTLSVSSSNADVASVIVLGTAVRIKGESVGSATVTVVAEDPGGGTASLDTEVTVVAATPG